MNTSLPPTPFVLPTPTTRPRRRRVEWLTALLLLALVLPAAGQAHFAYQTNHGALTLTRYTGPGGAVTIPSAVGRLPVTSIGLSAFYRQANLTSITIPASVTNLGTLAFAGCSRLSTIQGGAGLLSVGGSAFEGCSSLTNLTLPQSVRAIGSSAFWSCAHLVSVTLPCGLTNLGSGVFNYCTSLTNLTVDARNPAYSSLGGVLFDQRQATLLVYPAGLAGSYVMPDSVTSVGSEAFIDCANLSGVSIPPGVTNLGSRAFEGCYDLTSVSGGEGLTSIGQGAFLFCPRLDRIKFPLGLRSIEDSAFQDCLSLFQLTLPNSVTNIGTWAFRNCALTSVTLPSSVVHLGTRPFQDCFVLSAIAVDPLNAAYSSVDGVLFDRAQTTLLEYPEGKEWDYTIPDGVTNIADGAFNSCTRLSRVTIPSSVLRIGDGAFQGCGLTAIVVDPLNAAYSSVDGVLFDKAQATLLLYPSGAGASYTLPRGVTAIGANAFEDCYGLTSITLDDGLTLIGAHAFSSCLSLASVTLPNSVTTLGAGAFENCHSLTSVTLPNSLTNIGASAFSTCPALSSVTIPGHVSSLGMSAFAFCGGLRGVYFEGNAPSLGFGAFSFNTEATVYYVAGTAGWGKTFGGRPTAQWNLREAFTVSVATNGVGRVSGGGTFDGGPWRSLQAVPGAGWLFANWTEAGQVVSTASNYRFLLFEDRTLVANFVPNPFLAVAGTYHGLIGDTNGVAPQSSGSFTLTVTRQGRCSGAVLVGGVRYALSGQFDLNGQLSALIPAGAPALEVALQLDVSPGAERITGSVSPASWTAAWTAQLTGDRAGFNARSFPATNYAGRYTLVLPGGADSSLAPGGDSWGTLRVDAAGMVHLSASLSDGTKLTQAAPLSRDGTWALCASLYARQGLLQGWLGLTHTLTNDLCGSVVWIKPNTLGGTWYPEGFELTALASGSRYLPPPGQGALNLTHTELVLAGAGLAQGLTDSLTSQTDKVMSSPNHTHLTFNLATGAFAGRTPNPESPAAAPIPFSGVVLQKQHYGGGWFLGTHQSGSLYLGPE